MIVLARCDPARNLDRFYIIAIEPTLFGEWAVVREWGRRGSPGTRRTMTFDARRDAVETARAVLGRRRRRGYRHLAARSPPSPC